MSAVVPIAQIPAPKAKLVFERYWPLLPAIVFLVLLFVYPVAQLLWLSVLDKDGALSPTHYMRLGASPVYLQVLWTTVRIASWTTLFCLLAGYPLAFLIATSAGRVRQNLVLWVLMPFWTSFLVRTFAWIVLLGRKGLVSDLFLALGYAQPPVQLLYNMTGILIGMVHALMPLAVVTMLSVMENIDTNLPRAAATLGARAGQAFWRVYFPLSMPGVAAAGLLVFITALGFFITPALLGSGRDIMIAQVIIEQVDQLLNWAFAGAVAMLLLLTSLAIFYVYDRLFGLSTLAGQTGGSAADRKPRGLWVLGSLVGRLFIEVMCWLCDRFGEAVDAIRPIDPACPRKHISRRVLWIIGIATLFFLAAPAFFVIPVSFSTSSFIDWPPRGFTLAWYEKVLSSPQWVGAATRSFIVGILAAALAMLLSIPAAFVLVRQRIAGRVAMTAFLLSPLIIPRILIAVALFYFYSRVGLVGTSVGLVLGHAVVAMPYVVITIMAVLKNYDMRLDQAAWSLGASKTQTLLQVTLPLIKPGLLAAFLFAFVTSFDELTIALFVSGGLQTTIPKQMWDNAVLQVSPALAAASTLVMLFVTGMILIAVALRRKATT
jgi:ABC-type spermidine/putrescine transport system permease subunit I